jgi:uncharacterized membrane protein YtjA (UPF0391 family)
MDKNQFEQDIVIPTLKQIGLYSHDAVTLLMATAMAESKFHYIKQIKGPALGFYQMEPETHDDIWLNYLEYNKKLALKVKLLSVKCDARELQYNLKYATAMCRIHYLRVSESLPHADDPKAIANYWKQHYNTKLGKGSVTGFLAKTTSIFNKKETSMINTTIANKKGIKTSEFWVGVLTPFAVSIIAGLLDLAGIEITAATIASIVAPTVAYIVGRGWNKTAIINSEKVKK